MKFNSSYTNRPVPSPEIPRGGRKVVTAGYIPDEVRIKQMMLAGVRLKYFRQQYDSFDENEDIPLNPVRGKGLDIVEIDTQISMLKAKMKPRVKEEIVEDNTSTINATTGAVTPVETPAVP